MKLMKHAKRTAKLGMLQGVGSAILGGSPVGGSINTANTLIGAGNLAYIGMDLAKSMGKQSKGKKRRGR